MRSYLIVRTLSLENTALKGGGGTLVIHVLDDNNNNNIIIIAGAAAQDFLSFFLSFFLAFTASPARFKEIWGALSPPSFPFPSFLLEKKKIIRYDTTECTGLVTIHHCIYYSQVSLPLAEPANQQPTNQPTNQSIKPPHPPPPPKKNY